MNSEYLQQVRYKLQKRLKRLNSASYSAFHYTLVQTWGFLQENEITKGLLDDLETRSPDSQQPADQTLAGQPQVATSEAENNAICYWVIKKCILSDNDQIESYIGRSIAYTTDFSTAIEQFIQTYAEPLFDYIDEQIDDKRLILVLLKRFKHRCEWFQRETLHVRYKANSQQGELFLAYHLHEYLHDQGLQFHIEPQSSSGRIDLISSQSGNDRLVADAKLFNPDGGQNSTYIIKGFRQVYEYTKDFNEPFGYLVIFKTGEQDLSVPTQNQESAIPFITHNNKTVFIIVIDIFPYLESASKRGKLKAHEILPAQFVESLSESTPSC